MGRQHYGGDLRGRWILTAGLGGMGGAQPLAAVMAGRALHRDRVPGKPHRETARDALSRPARDQHRRGAGDHPHGDGADLASACSAMRRRFCPEMLKRGIRPDALTDQTSAHDPANGYLPRRLERRQVAGDARARSRMRWPPSREGSPWPATSTRCSPTRRWACRPSITATTSARWLSTRA